jgi:hypothetical protein
MINLNNLPPNYSKSKFLCPFCNQNLFVVNYEEEKNLRIYCGDELNKCCIGSNEGGWGKNENEAYEILKLKLAFR